MEGPSSPSAKTSKRRQRGLAAAVRRALFPMQAAGRRAPRLRAAGAAVGTTLLLLLLTAWAGKLRGVKEVLREGEDAGRRAPTTKTHVLSQQPRRTSGAAALHAAAAERAAALQPQGGIGRQAGADTEAVVEFTVPGLLLPLR